MALALSLVFSSQSTARAGQEALSPRRDVFTAESAPGLVPCDESTITPSQVYTSMIALKEQDAYKEGTTWTNDEPYSDEKGYYSWKGGPLDGANISAVGCVAFAFILSDAAFGSLPARMYGANAFQFEDIKVGDILRVNNDAHTVIVLEVSDVGIIVAEGNISTGDHVGKVHWGRAISKEDVMSTASHYITRYPEGYLPPDDPGANESIDSGTLDTGLTWNLTQAGTLTISGNGAMPDFSTMEEQPWNTYSSQIRKAVIAEGVTSIGACAFWKCGLLGAEISPSVTSIGNSAFRESSIVSITIPSGVKTIGDNAFQACQNLSTVKLNEGLETICQNAFRSCPSLTSITLPASIGEVGAAAFLQCQKLGSAVFTPGSKQVTLGDDLFLQCYNLLQVTLPQQINCISKGMFQNCLLLAGVEIPQGAESINESAFASSGVKVLLIPESVTTISTAAFSNCPLTEIYFTGTEAQWNSISKSADVITVVSKATIHYEYKPDTTPEPTPTTNPDPEPDPDPDPTQSPAPTQSPEPTQTPGPTATPKPEETPGPNPTKAPEQTSPPTPAPTQTPPLPTPTAPPTIPSIAGDSGKEGWTAIKDEAANASQGKQILVNMNGASVVPGDVLDSVKGQDVTLSFDMGNGIVWFVNGRNVTADHANDVNFSVQVGTSSIPEDLVKPVAGERHAMQLSLAHNGDFGYSAVLSISLGEAYAGLYANLFYYNPSTGRLEFVTTDHINEDGAAELTFTHASDYVIVVGEDVLENDQDSSEDNDASDDEDSSQKTESRSPKTGEVDSASGIAETVSTGNDLHFIWLLLTGTIGLAAAGTLVCLIRKRK